MSRVDDMPGYMASLAAAAVMAVTAVLHDVPPLYQSDAAVCCHLNDIFASIGRGWTTLAGYLLLWCVSAWTTRVNRRFNVEEGTSALPSSFFIIATASMPGFLTGITPGVLMALASILSFRWMFGCIDREQKAQPMFLVGTLMAFGSMVEYAFIPLGAAMAVAAAGLGLFDIRSVAGYVMGLMTPYILVYGFMITNPPALTCPALWWLAGSTSWPAVIVAGVTALTAVILMLRSAVTPPARSSRGIALNRALISVLFILIIAMGADYRNFTAYFPSVALITGFGVAGLSGERNTASAATILIVALAVVYITCFIFAL